MHILFPYTLVLKFWWHQHDMTSESWWFSSVLEWVYHCQPFSNLRLLLGIYVINPWNRHKALSKNQKPYSTHAILSSLSLIHIQMCIRDSVGTFRRPIRKLCLLPARDEPQTLHQCNYLAQCYILSGHELSLLNCLIIWPTSIMVICAVTNIF